MSHKQPIDVREIRKAFKSTSVLNGLTFDLQRGEIVGILGPNGAGKTTTLRILLGLTPPDSGLVTVFGFNPITEGTELRRLVGVLLEHDGLYDRLSAHDNLAYHGRLQHLSAIDLSNRITEVLSTFDLVSRRDEPVGKWSKGMRQKLGVARAMLHRPPLLLLDEPFSGLDPRAAVELRDRLQQLSKNESVSILLTTHDLAHAEKFCDRVLVIEAGQVIASGSPDKIGQTEADLLMLIEGSGLSVRVLEELVNEGVLLGFDMKGDAAHVRCSLNHNHNLGPRLIAAGVQIRLIQPVQRSLESRLVSLTNPFV